MKIELTAVDVVNNDELKCWTVTGDGRGGVMDGHGDGRCLKWPKGPNGDPQLAGVWEPTLSPSSKKGRIGYSTLLTRRDMGQDSRIFGYGDSNSQVGERTADKRRVADEQARRWWTEERGASRQDETRRGDRDVTGTTTCQPKRELARRAIEVLGSLERVSRASRICLERYTFAGIPDSHAYDDATVGLTHTHTPLIWTSLLDGVHELLLDWSLVGCVFIASYSVVQARLEVSIGLGASLLVCMIGLRYAFISSDKLLSQGKISGIGVLQVMWLAHNNVELHMGLVQIANPTDNALRRAGMVNVCLVGKKDSVQLGDFPKQPDSLYSEKAHPLYSRRDQLSCLILHILLILIHVFLLTVIANKHAERQITFSLAAQQSISLWVTILSTGFGTTYLALVLYLTQNGAIQKLINKTQAITATHDQGNSWAGLGAALISLFKQRVLSASVAGTLWIFVYLGLLSLLHVMIPSMVTVQAFNQTSSAEVQTSGVPMWDTSATASNGSTQFLQDVSGFFGWRNAINTSMIGLSNNTLYDVLAESIPTSSNSVNVAAVGFNVTCGYPANVSLTHVPFYPGLSILWNVTTEIEADETISFLLPPSGPNLITTFPMRFLRPNILSVLSWPSIILYTTTPVLDSTGIGTTSMPNPGTIIFPGSLDMNRSVPSIQMLQCMYTVVNQTGKVDTQSRMLDPSSLHQRVHKMESRWGVFVDEGGDQLNDIRGPMASGLWPIPDDVYMGTGVPISLDQEDASNRLSTMDLFLIDCLNLNPSWLMKNNTAFSPMQTLYLHDIENALADFAASFFWIAGHIRPPALETKYNVATMDSGYTLINSTPPVLAIGNVSVERIDIAVRLELNVVAVSIGLAASVVSFLLACKLILHKSQSSDGYLVIPKQLGAFERIRT
ncbi:hypothetical protein C8F01DRAFT_1320443 [Mycena amicta]|nr:hypothetical protein C8F01DRAFT_1320443 [Mycena amicta]